MCQIWLRSDRRECNAGMTIPKCTKTAASSNVSNHLSRTPIARFASGAAHHARPYRNLGRRISLRSYTIVDVIATFILEWTTSLDTSSSTLFVCRGPGTVSSGIYRPPQVIPAYPPGGDTSFGNGIYRPPLNG